MDGARCLGYAIICALASISLFAVLGAMLIFDGAEMSIWTWLILWLIASITGPLFVFTVLTKGNHESSNRNRPRHSLD